MSVLTNITLSKKFEGQAINPEEIVKLHQVFEKNNEDESPCTTSIHFQDGTSVTALEPARKILGKILGEDRDYLMKHRDISVVITDKSGEHIFQNTLGFYAGEIAFNGPV